MADDLCQCPRCGRMHRHLAAGPPPAVTSPPEGSVAAYHGLAVTDLNAAAADLYAALFWALPLANMALEKLRLTRIRAGHTDIGAGTARIGLYPEDQAAFKFALAALQKAKGKTL